MAAVFKYCAIALCIAWESAAYSIGGANTLAVPVENLMSKMITDWVTFWMPSEVRTLAIVDKDIDNIDIRKVFRLVMGDMMMPFMIYSSMENTLLYHVVMEYNKSSTIFMTGNKQFLQTTSTKKSVMWIFPDHLNPFDVLFLVCSDCKTPLNLGFTVDYICDVLIAIPNENDISSLSIYELLYSFKRKLTDVSFIGTWNYDSKFQLKSKPSNKVRNMEGAVLKVGYVHNPPLIYVSNRTGKFALAGTLSIPFYVFQQCLKFDYEASDFVANPGQIGSTGNMTRIEVAFHRQGYDFLIAMLALSKKATYDTLVPAVTRSYMFVVRRPTFDTTHVFYIILAPFQTLSWAAFLSAFIIITSVLYLIQRIREQAILAEALDAITRAMVQQGSVYLPKEASGRVVYFIGYFTMFILFAHYSCALTSIMTIEQCALGIESLEDLVNSDFQIIVTEGAASFVDESLQVFVLIICAKFA